MTSYSEAKYQPILDIVGGGGFVSTYNYDGGLSVNSGTERYYLHTSVTLASVDLYIESPSIGSSVNIAILKNGSTIGTASVSAGQTSSLNNIINVGLVQGDYITVNITQVGSTYPGRDMMINMIFN